MEEDIYIKRLKANNKFIIIILNRYQYIKIFFQNIINHFKIFYIINNRYFLELKEKLWVNVVEKWKSLNSINVINGKPFKNYILYF